MGGWWGGGGCSHAVENIGVLRTRMAWMVHFTEFGCIAIWERSKTGESLDWIACEYDLMIKITVNELLHTRTDSAIDIKGFIDCNYLSMTYAQALSPLNPQ